jgi:microcystin-dependent protein
VAQTALPFNNADVNQLEWSLMMREVLETGVLPGRLNELEVFADSTGKQVKVKSGHAWMLGHWYRSTAQETLAISDADAGNPRIDRVVLRLDWTANTILLAVLTGTPAVAPLAPTPTQVDNGVWEISLAKIAVAAGASTIALGDVSDERIFAYAPGAAKPGDVKVIAHDSPDRGWLLCNGQAISRTVFADLFAKIATTFGSGDGSTSFNVPDWRGRFLIGLDSAKSAIDAVGKTGGTWDASINPAPATTGAPSSTTSADQGADSGQPIGPVASSTHTHDVDLPAINIPNPPFGVVNFAIKY